MSTLARARQGLAAPARAALDVAGEVAARGFGFGSRVRRTKFFHPHGVVHEAQVVTHSPSPAPPAARVLSEPREYDALIRFSRGAGAPAGIPDVLGMAIRLLDAHGPSRHQDFLLVTSGDGAVIQHLLLPARRFSSRPYSSVLPYRAGDETFLIGARAVGAPPVADDEFDELARFARRRGPAFEMCIAPLGRRLRPIGEITLGKRLEPDANRIRFDPWNTGGGLEPATALNRIRAYVYPSSQSAWEGTPTENLSAER